MVNGDEGDPGSYIDKHLMEQCPRLLLEGMALAGYAVGSEHGLVLVRSEYPDSTPILRGAIEIAYAEGELGDDIHGSGFSFHVEVEEGAGSYVVGEETALLGSLQGLRGTVNARPPFPAQRGWHGKPTVVNNVETLCNAPYIAANGAEAYKALSPDATPGVKLVCLNERFANPGIFEVPFGTPVSHICNELGGGLKDGKEIKAVQIGGPLGGVLPHWLLDTPLDFDDLAEHGCMVGHGSILAFDEDTDIRELCTHLLEFGADESCGKCFPCRIGLQRAVEMSEAPGDIDREKLEALLETLELGSLCAHGGGMPAPIRTLIEFFPGELGLTGGDGPGQARAGEGVRGRPPPRGGGHHRPPRGAERRMKVTVDGIDVDVPDGATVLEAARMADRWVPTLCFDERMVPFGACRVCMVGAGGQDGPIAACTTPVHGRHGGAHHRRHRAARGHRHGGAGDERAALGAGRHTELMEIAERLEVGEPRWTGAVHEPRHDERHPYLSLHHELCISCGRCVRACDEIQGAFALTATGRGFGSNVAAGLDSGFTDSTCVSCGACADTCPTDAITEHSLLDLLGQERSPA